MVPILIESTAITEPQTAATTFSKMKRGQQRQRYRTTDTAASCCKAASEGRIAVLSLVQLLPNARQKPIRVTLPMLEYTTGAIAPATLQLKATDHAKAKRNDSLPLAHQKMEPRHALPVHKAKPIYLNPARVLSYNKQCRLSAFLLRRCFLLCCCFLAHT